MNREFETLSVSDEGDGVWLLTLNRPESRNAINTQMGRDLREIFVPLAFHPGEARCILITGAGDKAFCSGGDLKERNGMSDADWRAQHALFEEAFYALMGCSVPVIAAVNGAAYAGGCELALACDFIYAAETARFALTETTLGIIPGLGGPQNLPRAIGARRAKEIILTGRPFSAQDGHAWGLVNRLLPLDQLVPVALETAKAIGGNGPVAVRQAKKAIHHGLDVDLRTGLAFGLEAYNQTVVTEDRIEGVRAFNEKRKPKFQGR
jgi:enoyl-CoA hydratase/carnithine racemase